MNAARISLPVEPVFLKVPEAAAMAGVSRDRLYQLMRAGEIPFVKVGANRRVPVEGIRVWAARLVAEQNSGDAA